MAVDRLSAQDVTFLHLEGPDTPYHVASVETFLGAEGDYRQLVDQLHRRLHLVPRFRRKLAWVPFGVGRPVWVDDVHFDLSYHVRHTVLPSPGTEEQLKSLVGTLMEQHLDRARPLWEMYLIEGLEGDRFAIFTKSHHCMIDGISGVDITALLLDPSPTPAGIEPEPWTPAPEPSSLELLRDALWERATVPAEAARGVRRLLRTPRNLVRETIDVLAGAGALGWAGIHPVPGSPLNLHVGPNRRFDYVRSSLDDMKAIKNALGGKVNDVVLAVVTAGLRKWMLGRDALTDGLELKAMVPVDIRTASERDGQGNRVSTIIAPLPVAESDPLRRYGLIREGTKRAKRSHQVIGADLLIQVSGFAPQTVVAQITRIQNVQRFFNLPITNVPGPQQPLYGVGHRMLDLIPLAPLGGNMAMTVAVMSYDGGMTFGLVADDEAVPDLDVICDGIRSELEQLRSLAGIGPPHRKAA